MTRILWLPHKHTTYATFPFPESAKRCHNSWLEYHPEYTSYGYCPDRDLFVWSEDIPVRYRKHPQEEF